MSRPPARQGINVCNARGYGTPAVVQHVYALILVLTTRLPSYLHAVAEGRWQRRYQFCILDYPIRELRGLTLGIVVYGAPGRPSPRSCWIPRCRT